MAVFDAVSHPAATGNAVTTLSWTHTPTATPTGVAVLVISRITSGVPNTPTVTYGGVAMTQLGTGQGGAGGTEQRVTGFYLANPATGAQTVAVAFGGQSQGSANALAVTATQESGTGWFTSQNSLASLTATVTPPTSDLAVAISGSDTSGAGWVSDGANQTNRLRDNSGAQLDIEGSTRDPGFTGAMTATLTAATTGNNLCGAVTFKTLTRWQPLAVIYMRRNV